MDLSSRIQAMWEKRGRGYRPRTRHLDEQGRAIHIYGMTADGNFKVETFFICHGI